MDESRPPDWTNLHWAIWTQDLESVKQILSAEGTDINAQDQLGWTPLHLACCSNSSRLWETGQLHPRGLNSQTGPGFDLTIRPGAIHRYKVLGYSSSSSTGPGDELDKSNLAESTVSFFIALELLQASAEVNTSHHHAPLHCAASSGWTDHVDALLFFGAIAHPENTCPPVCYALQGRTSSHRMVFEYLKKRLGPWCWNHGRGVHHQCGGSLPSFTWPTSEFKTWLFNHHLPNTSIPALPGAAGAVRLETIPSSRSSHSSSSTTVCALCRGISVRALRSLPGYLHAKSFRDLELSAPNCPLCGFLFSVISFCRFRRLARATTQLILRGDTNSSCTPQLASLRVQLSSGCYCKNFWYDDQRKSPDDSDFSSCVGSCRSMLLEDVELDLFTDDREVSLLQSTDGIQFGSLPDRDGLPENLGVMVSSWLQQCKGTHIRCGSHNSHVDDGPHRELPTRLVDVTRFRNAGRVSLASGSALKTTVEYVALSHRWPPGRPTDYEWTTKTTNEDTRRDGFAANILPRAVQDAINMTSQIGIHYLWVDSLCIVQDSRQDWELESSKMLSVFGNAAVTFFADCAENDNDSFLKPRALGQFQSRRGVSLDILGPNNRPLKTCLVERYSRYKSDPPAKATNLFLEDVIQSHLSTRGWIFQEQVISPRRLHFGRHQMYWACGESYKAEDGTKLDMVLPDWYRWLSNPRQNGATDMTNILGEESAELWLQHRNWAMLVEDYTMRSLTVSADKFRALAALAKVFGRTFQDVYMVGCWKRCFRLNLLWSARRADGSSSHPTQRNGQIPSWSWLSADGAVEYPHLRVRSPTKTEQTGLIHVYFIVVDLPEIIPDVSDPFGSIPIFCGPIKVKGLLEPAICSQSGEQLFHSEAPHWSRRMQQRPEETPYLLLYSKSNPEKAIGSMIPDRRNGILLGEVMLFKTTETQGQCLCCGFDKTNHIHFLVLERELDAVERFHRVGFGWTYVREDQMMMLRSTEIHDGRGLWLGEPQLLEIV